MKTTSTASAPCKDCIVTTETTGDKIGTHVSLCKKCAAAVTESEPTEEFDDIGDYIHRNDPANPDAKPSK